LSAEQASHRLGVKPQTLYAYVSRGLLQSHPVSGPGRSSRYARAEVERLAERRRSGGRAGGLELLVDTELTLLDPSGHLYFRGWDAIEAAGVASYERVAEWLWSGEDRSEPPAWVASPEAVAVAEAATAALPAAAGPVDRLRVATAAVATTDPLRGDRRPEAVTIAARSLIAALVECLPRPGSAPSSGPPRLSIGGVTRRDSIAGRLWPRLAGDAAPGIRRGRAPAASSQVSILNSALAMLADHELAASTLAARVAASTWADPYLVILTGLGALGGPLHGAASHASRLLIEEVSSGRPAAEAIGSRLRDGERIAGFGHSVYHDRDPRCDALLAQLKSAWGGLSAWRTVTDILDVMADRALPAPNIDFAIATFCHFNGLMSGAGEAIFAVARCAGWIAHAIEEYPHRLRFRPRAVYVGVPPGR
jgi:citrate synthase